MTIREVAFAGCCGRRSFSAGQASEPRPGSGVNDQLRTDSLAASAVGNDDASQTASFITQDFSGWRAIDKVDPGVEKLFLKSGFHLHRSGVADFFGSERIDLRRFENLQFANQKSWRKFAFFDLEADVSGFPGHAHGQDQSRVDFGDGCAGGVVHDASFLLGLAISAGGNSDGAHSVATRGLEDHGPDFVQAFF